MQSWQTFFKVSTKKSNKIQEKKVLTVNIEKLDLNGCGVAYYKKKTCVC